MDAEADLVDRAVGLDPAYSITQEHDFGAVLARGQILSHQFALRNPTGRVIHLVRGTALSPCCSSVGPLPESIAPGGEVSVPVVLKAGYRSEKKRVEFAVETDDEERPVYTLAVRASLLSEWEIDQGNASLEAIPLGESRKRTFRVTARRQGNEGKDPPERVSGSPGLVATFTGDATQADKGDGVIERTRSVELTFAALKKPGLHQEEVRFRWTGGEMEVARIAWEVRPRVTIHPSGLVLKPSDKPREQTVIVRSAGRPVRVTSVTSPLLAKPPELSREPSPSVRIPLVLDAARVKAEGVVDVVIATDDPDQPTATLSVMLLHDSTGAAP